MDEAKASWNTIYQTKDGFESQITLRDEEESALGARAAKMMVALLRSGSAPVRRRGNGNREEAPGNGNGEDKPEKTYVDEDEVRRCNLKLKSGQICGSPVTEREGKYGQFWSCPNYKEHAA